MSIFTQVRNKKVPSSKFNLSHDRKFSMKFGELTPCFLQETIPGDKWNINTSQMMRFAPMIAPIMHNVNLYVHFFFVPNRICWSGWEDFITGGADGKDDTLFPTFQSQVTDVGSLQDFMGVPIHSTNTEQINAIPFSAYGKIYNDYYRDQNLIDEITFDLRDGEQTIAIKNSLKIIRQRAWQKDYFTSALPWTQRGEEVTMPLGTTAPITYDHTQGGITKIKDLVGADAIDVPVGQFNITGGAGGFSNQAVTVPGQVQIDNSGLLFADLSDATASTINDLRQAFRLQEFLERNARSGSRYIEVIASHFNVRSSDARLQRPEYLGGMQSPITVSEVLQTSDAAAGETPQGNMAGHGISVGASNKISYFCEEHGFIIGIVSVIPKSSYQQGLPKIFSKFDKFDYYWPSFAHLGEQPILSKELYFDNDYPKNDEVFGYTPRYAEYKFINSSVHGEFRDSLDFWHLGRKFTVRPTLSKSFIEMTDAETERIFSVLDAERLYVHMFHTVSAERRMPYFGTPKI